MENPGVLKGVRTNMADHFLKICSYAFYVYLQACNIDISPEECQDCLKCLDSNGDGKWLQALIRN